MQRKRVRRCREEDFGWPADRYQTSEHQRNDNILNRKTMKKTVVYLLESITEEKFKDDPSMNQNESQLNDKSLRMRRIENIQREQLHTPSICNVEIMSANKV